MQTRTSTQPLSRRSALDLAIARFRRSGREAVESLQNLAAVAEVEKHRLGVAVRIATGRKES